MMRLCLAMIRNTSWRLDWVVVLFYIYFVQHMQALGRSTTMRSLRSQCSYVSIDIGMNSLG